MITRWKWMSLIAGTALLAGCRFSLEAATGVWGYALVAVIGAVGLFLTGRDLLRGRSSAAWPTTQGEVVYSSMEQHMSTDSDGDRSVTYGAKIVYNYQVGGQQLTGDRRAFSESRTSSARRAQEIANRYQVGAQVTVYYDSNNPQVSVLEPGVGLGGMIVPVITLGLLVFGVYKVVDALFI
jgi:hypothetical protein